MIGGVTVDGVAIADTLVEYSFTFRHGRADAYDGPTPSSAALRMIGVDRAELVAVGGRLVVELTDTTPRFTGTITDLRLVDDELSIVAIGLLADLGRRPLAAATLVVEPASDRLAAIFDEAGVDPAGYVIALGSFDPDVAARDRDPTTALVELEFLAQTVGAAVYDRPDGVIVVEALDARAAIEHVLDSAKVAYAPEWTQEMIVENRVTVDGADPVTATVDDEASQAAYDVRAVTITTDLADSVDAAERARVRVARRAFPRWHIPALTVLELHAAIGAGDQVAVSDLPASAPYATYAPVVEGWVDTVTAEDWTTVYTCSDPALSGLTLTWDDVTSTLTWATVDPPDVPWHDAISNAAIGG